MATKEYFPGIGKIKFEGKESKNPMAFRYYDAEKVINGKKMNRILDLLDEDDDVQAVYHNWDE